MVHVAFTLHWNWKMLSLTVGTTQSFCSVRREGPQIVYSFAHCIATIILRPVSGCRPCRIHEKRVWFQEQVTSNRLFFGTHQAEVVQPFIGFSSNRFLFGPYQAAVQAAFIVNASIRLRFREVVAWNRLFFGAREVATQAAEIANVYRCA